MSEERVARASLAGTLAAGDEEAVYQVVIMAAGHANGWEWPPGVLAAAVRDGLFAQLTSFVDHRYDPHLVGARSVRDVCGVVYDTAWDAARAAVVGRFRPAGPLGAWADGLLRQTLADQAAGRPVPTIGLSTDLLFTHSGRRATRIVRVLSADLVFNPAAGGVFEARLTPKEEAMTETTALSQQLLARQCAATLAAALAASDLPAPLRAEVRAQFEGAVFSPDELEAALQGKRATWAALAEGRAVRGLSAPSAPPAPSRVSLWTDLERLQLAVDRLLGAPLPDAHADTPRLTGVREMYPLVTGDRDMRGVFDAERAAFANANAATMATLVKNAMNKAIAARAAELGRAGYDWYKRIVHEEDFDTLQPITWATVGGFGDLPSVAEGAAYTELAWDDSGETTDWTKSGGYIGLTLEMIDRDETRRVRAIPNLLATAGVRTLSAAIAALFTQASGAGPTLADGVALFHSTRGNVSTNSLTAANWDVAVQAMFKQAELNSGKRLGVRPRYLLVPIELEKTALLIFTSATEPSSNVFYENVRRAAAENVLVVPEWTSAFAWAAVADPSVAPGLGVGYRFGRVPEVFVADQPEVGSMFTHDELRVKARFIYGVGVVDPRPLYKSNATA